jgi:hypothetical protein
VNESRPTVTHIARSNREFRVAAALFVALTLVLTFPLSISPHRNVIAQGGDDEEVMWIVGWDVHAFTHHPLSMFDANILYPEPKTLAYAENLIGSALFAAPVMWLTGNLILAINVVALLSCALCGLGGYVLARRIGLSVGAAAICGVIFAFSPPRFMRTIQIHVGAVQWIPFTLASLHKYFDEGNRRDVRLAAVFATMQALTSGHGAVFVVVAVAFLVAWRMMTGEPLVAIRALRDLGAVGLLIFLPAVLVFLPYRSVQQTLLGGSTLGNWRTTPESFLASPTHLHTWIRPLVTGVDVNAAASAWIFPGYLPIALALLALVWRPSGDRDDRRRRTAWIRAAVLIEIAFIASLAAAVAMTTMSPLRWRITDTIVFSARSSSRTWAVCVLLLAGRCLMLRRAPFDPAVRLRWIADSLTARRRDPTIAYALIVLFSVWVSIAPPSPYWRIGLWRFIYDWPVLNFVRATSRFTVLGLLALAVLAAVGFDRVSEHLRARTAPIAATVVVLLLIAEFAIVPLGVTPFRIEFPGAERWLAAQKPPFVVAEVPISVSPTTYMLHSMAHWQKTVHGTARVIPAPNQILYEQLQHFPDESSVGHLQQFGVTYVVVHMDYYPAEQRAHLDEQLRALSSCLTLRYIDPESRVYSIF